MLFFWAIKYCIRMKQTRFSVNFFLDFAFYLVLRHFVDLILKGIHVLPSPFIIKVLHFFKGLVPSSEETSF